MSREQLVQACRDKDSIIASCVSSLKSDDYKMLNKKDVMALYGCESDKALKILRIMFQMGYGNKIGKEYYVSQKGQRNFVDTMAGQEVFI